MNARKGLKKYGMRAYIVEGAGGRWLIERERPARFIVYPEGWARAPMPPGKAKRRVRDHFFTKPPFRRLSEARSYVEKQAGIT